MCSTVCIGRNPNTKLIGFAAIQIGVGSQGGQTNTGTLHIYHVGATVRISCCAGFFEVKCPVKCCCAGLTTTITLKPAGRSNVFLNEKRRGRLECKIKIGCGALLFKITIDVDLVFTDGAAVGRVGNNYIVGSNTTTGGNCIP